ncbi:hypothetical protein K6U15_13395, partial [Vibrio parahaemolyticus]|nr:hypothetical protein [Vibrio parahaemolyticus]
VKDMKILDDYLEHKDKVYNAPVTTSENDNEQEPDSPGIETVPEEFSQPTKAEPTPVSQAKPKNNSSNEKHNEDTQKDSVVLPFREKKETKKQAEANSVSQAKSEQTDAIEDTDFFEDQVKQPKHNTKSEKTNKPSISQSPELQKNEQSSTQENELS